jgi:putative membrane protein
MRFRVFLVCLILAAALAACKNSESVSDASATSGTDAAAATTTTDTMVPAATATIAENDKNFVMDAGKGGKAEVGLASDAVQRSSNAEVKAFAQKIVDDHTKANDKLTTIATGKGVTIPDEVPPDATAAKEKLAKLTGKSFDQAFAKQMVDDHTKTIAKFEDESKNGADPEVKAFADDTLPALREHLKMSQDLQTKVGKPK